MVLRFYNFASLRSSGRLLFCDHDHRLLDSFQFQFQFQLDADMSSTPYYLLVAGMLITNHNVKVPGFYLTVQVLGLL